MEVLNCMTDSTMLAAIGASETSTDFPNLSTTELDPTPSRPTCACGTPLRFRDFSGDGGAVYAVYECGACGYTERHLVTMPATQMGLFGGVA